MDNFIYICIAIGIFVIISLFEKKSEKKSEKKPAKPSVIFDFDVDDVKKHNKQKNTSKKIYPPALPQEILPEEGQRVSSDEPVFDMELAERQKKEKLEQHRNRWRKAIIDSEILTPRF